MTMGLVVVKAGVPSGISFACQVSEKYIRKGVVEEKPQMVIVVVDELQTYITAKII